MERQLTIEKRGDLFHLSFHNYMGPWEGHEIERKLRLEEVDPPAGGAAYEKVLGPNQCYMWHEMDRHPELHALVTGDRMKPLAEIVRHKDVYVLEGKEFLPEMPQVNHLSEESYIAYIERLHESPWKRGPRAVAKEVLIRAVPTIIILFALFVGSRHMGDHYQTVEIDEIFARAERPPAEQNFFAGILAPDYSHLVRNEIRTVRYAHGSRMILGDGSYIEFEGIRDVMPWLTEASSRNSALQLEAQAASGEVRIEQIECGGEIIARNVRLHRIAKLAEGDPQPPRGQAEQAGLFRVVEALSVDLDASEELEDLKDQRISVEGKIVEEDGAQVVRMSNGVGVIVDSSRSGDDLRQFLDAFSGSPGAVKVDLVLAEVFPWENRDDITRARATSQILGLGEAYSASAQNHHVVGRR